MISRMSVQGADRGPSASSSHGVVDAGGPMSEPPADRGPQVGSPLGVVDAGGQPTIDGSVAYRIAALLAMLLLAAAALGFWYFFG